MQPPCGATRLVQMIEVRNRLDQGQAIGVASDLALEERQKTFATLARRIKESLKAAQGAVMILDHLFHTER